MLLLTMRPSFCSPWYSWSYTIGPCRPCHLATVGRLLLTCVTMLPSPSSTTSCMRKERQAVSAWLAAVRLHQTSICKRVGLLASERLGD